MLSEKEKKFFQKNGYLTCPTIVNLKDLSKFKQLCNNFMEKRGMLPELSSGPQEPLFWIRCKKEECEEFSKIGSLYDDVKKLASILLKLPKKSLEFKLRIFYKLPNSLSDVAWHQDEAFYQRFSQYRVDGYRSVNCWFALDDANKDSGCLKYIPGSHKNGLIKHKLIPSSVREGKTRESDEQANVTLKATKVEESKAIYSDVKAGTLNIHHARTLHASDSNTSKFSRGAFIMIFREKL